MDSLYFVKKDSEGNITGTGQWHPGDAVNYTGHEQVSKKEWERVNKEVVFPRLKKLREKEEAKKVLQDTLPQAVEALETNEPLAQEVKDRRNGARKVLKELKDAR